MIRLLALASVAALALALAGCRGGSVLDATKTEEQLESSLEKSLPGAFEGPAGEELAKEIGVNPGTGIESVECPTDIEVEKGAESHLHRHLRQRQRGDREPEDGQRGRRP